MASNNRYRNDDTELNDLVNGYWGEWELDEQGHSRFVEDDNADRALAYQEKMNRLNAVGAIYQRLDRIITGDSEVTVSIISDKESDTNAKSNGRDITLNGNLIEDVTDESILSLHGLNYHELAHVLYSPRIGSALGKFVQENQLFPAVTILEEGRAEQLLLSKYPSLRPYLEASAYTYLLSEKPSEWGGKFHTVTGRTYLPLELRQYVTDKAVEKYGVPTVEKVHRIVHEYRNLVFPRDFDRAKELLLEMSDIVGRSPKPKEDECAMPNKGRPAGQGEQDQLQKYAPQSPTESIKEQGQPINTGASQEGETNENGDKAGLKSGTEASDVPTQTADQADNLQDESIIKAINDKISEIKKRSDVRRELSDTRNAILNSDEVRAEIKSANTLDRQVTPEGAVTAKRFSMELERLVRDNDPAWNTRKPSGRLNIQRTMNPDVNAISEAFDEWYIGNEATDIEAVILTDNSGSMGGNMRTVCETAWIIKRGVESIDGNVTVFAFDSDTTVLYNAKEKAKPSTYRSINSMGFTNPIRGLIEANRILNSSKKSIKILFVLTDGEWDKEKQCDSLIQQMNESGVITSVVYLSDPYSLKNLTELSQNDPKKYQEYMKRVKHGAKEFHAVGNVKDVLSVATNLVKSRLKRVA